MNCKHCGKETLGVEVAVHLRPMCATCWGDLVHLDAETEAEFAGNSEQ